MTARIVGATMPASDTDNMGRKIHALIFSASLIGCGVQAPQIDTMTQAVATATIAAFPLYESFETGTLADYWATNTTVDGRVQVVASADAHNGSYHVQMDDTTGDTTLSLTELTLAVGLAGQTDVTLRFFARDYTDELHRLPTTFTGSANGDGVSISSDCNQWYRIVDLGAQATATYRAFTIDLDAAATTAGITLTTPFYIKFSQYDDWPVPTDGFGIDTIEVATQLADITPPTGSISIEQGAATTLTASVTLYLTATDDSGTVAEMSFSNDGSTWSPWQAYTSTRSGWSLTDPAFGGTTAIGSKSVRARYRDARQNTSPVYTDSITYNPPPQAAAFPFAEDFESGGLGPWWRTSSTNQGRILVTTGNGPNGGARHVLMDDTVDDSTYSNNELTLAINLAGRSDVALLFSARIYGEEVDVLPAMFTTTANGDGVSISADGVTWYSLFDTTQIASVYGRHSINLDDAIATAGISYNSSFRIRFQQYDNWPVPSDGIGWDDIVVLDVSSDVTPPTGTVVVGAGTTTSVALVDLTLSASDGVTGTGVTQMRFSNDGNTWSAWEANATSKLDWDITDTRYGGVLTPGTKIVRAEFRDLAGNISTPATDPVDFVPPSTVCAGFSTTMIGANATASGTLSIVDQQYVFDGYGNRYFDSFRLDLGGMGTVTVTHNSTAYDPIIYVYETSAGCTLVGRELGTGTSASLNFNAALNATYVAVVTTTAVNTLGSYSVTTVSTIVDATAPTGTVIVNGGGTTTANTTVNLTLSASDVGGSGVADMQFSNNGVTFSAWETYATSKVWDMSSAATGGNANAGLKTVRARYRDGAGNVSATYSDSITYTPATPASFPFTEGWETGTFASWWTTQSTAAGRIRILTTNAPNTGTRHVVMDSGVDSTFSLNELTLTINLTGRTNVRLRFFAKQFTDEAHQLPVSFTGSANGDGVAISADGLDWRRVWDGTTQAVGTHTAQDIDLDAAIAAASIAYNGTFRIRFSQYDDFGVSTDGYAFDDIEVLSVQVDPTAPTGSVTINTGAATTSSFNVMLLTPATDTGGSGLADMSFSNNGATWSPWETYAATKSSWDMSSATYGGTTAAGTKTVYARYRDGFGNVSVTYSDTITYIAADTTPPTGTISIANGAATTGTLVVTLNLSATDTGGSGISQMRFSNNGSTWSSWEAYRTTKSWDLSDVLYGGTTATGTKRAYVRYRDSAFNESMVYSDTIVYQVPDTTAPTGSISVANGAAMTGSLVVGLTLSASDAGSGLDDMQFSNNGSTWSAWEPYATARNGWDLSTFGGSTVAGSKTVYARYRDVAGNVSVSYNDTIVFMPPDNNAPTGSISIAAGAPNTMSLIVVLNLAATDDASGVADMQFSNDGQAWSPWEAFALTKPAWDLGDVALGGTAAPGTKAAYARYRDVAGNVSVAYSDTIDYSQPDTTPPTGTISIAGGAASTSSPIVTLGLSATDTGGSGLTEMQLSNDANNWGPWEMYAATRTGWDLTSAAFGGNALPGAKTVSARYRDAAQNVSAVASAAIRYEPIDNNPPTAPSNTLAIAIASSAIDLSWSAATDDVAVVLYEVEKSTDGAMFTKTATTTGLRFTERGLSPMTTFFYRVRAIDTSGNVGPYGDVAMATTLMMTDVDAGFIDTGVPIMADSGVSSGVDGGPRVDSGPNSRSGAGGRRSRESSGCVCVTPQSSTQPAWLVFGVLAAGVLVRRRRR